jgi:hypothetical protein
MMTIQSVQINKLSDLIKILEDLANPGDILFRGQTKASWPLLPKIARIMRGECSLKEEKEILKTFIKNSYPLMKNRPDTDLGWLAVAQHHGLPTRLLDWSLNPLAALWFAVGGTPPDNDNGILWAYNPPEDTLVNLMNTSEEPDPFDIDRAYVYFPQHEDLRIRVQSGIFTIHCRKNKTQEFIPFEDANVYANTMIKMLILPESFDRIKKSLRQCGVHAGSLMPDLDGLAAYVISKYE